MAMCFWPIWYNFRDIELKFEFDHNVTSSERMNSPGVLAVSPQLGTKHRVLFQ